MKIKTWFVPFFKCSFVLRVGVVIFELNKVSMSNFVKFEFLGMTLKIERVYFETKTGQMGHEFSNKKVPQPMLNFLHEKKIHFL